MLSISRMPMPSSRERIDSGWNCTAAMGRAPVLQRHDDAVVGLGGDPEQVVGKGHAPGVERVVAADLEARRQAPKERGALHLDLRRLAVDRLVELIEPAAEILGHGLEPQAHPEERHVLRQHQRDGLGGAEIFGAARTRREHDEIGRAVAQCFARGLRPERLDLGAGLAQVVGERVDEGILVIHQQHATRRHLAGPGERAPVRARPPPAPP